MRHAHRLVLLLSVLGASGAATEVPDSGIVPVVTLRDAGYLLGDLLDEQIELQLPAGFAIDVGSLPAPGRVAPWLEVRSARANAARSDGTVAVTVTYQIFAEAELVSRVPIPPFKLRVVGGSQARRVAIPEKSFLLSPALPSTLSDEDRELKPSPAPKPLPLARTLAVLAVSLFVALAAAAWLLWVNDRLPFLPHAPGPFARLWRRWRRRAGARVPWRPWIAGKGSRTRHGLDAAERMTLLREWHAALSEAAGETLYASTLPGLFERAAHLRPLQGRIETLFRHSWQAFYAAVPDTEVAAAEIIGVLREAAQRERGVPC
jgi:mxaA protein